MRPQLSSSGRSLVLEARARALRSSETPSERMLWSALRGGVDGVHFKRQVPLLGRFIADFVAPSVKLVVEVDGGIHARKRTADARRDEKLRRAGYCVLRVPADLVMRELPLALARIRKELGG